MGTAGGVGAQRTRRIALGILLITAITIGLGEAQMSHAGTANGVKNVVLVHGAFVDGSGWEGVYRLLKKDGYSVTIVQNPTISLAGDVAVTKRALAAQSGPAILVGHSYGGVVITEAGSDPNVAGLVYIAAFAPDKNESVSSLIKDPPPGRRSRRSCRRRTDSYSSTGPSSGSSSRPTWRRMPRPSWPMHRCLGVWRR